jgi:hypothetical protein
MKTKESLVVALFAVMTALVLMFVQQNDTSTVLASAGTAPIQGILSHYTSNGQYVNASFYRADASSYSYSWLYVSQGSSGNDAATYLNYWQYSCNSYAGCRWDYAFGQIPNADLGGAGRNMRLSTNLNRLQGYATLPSGEIDLVWTANGVYSSSHNGVDVYSYGDFHFHSNGRSENRSASTQGSIFGLSQQTYSAAMGTNYQNTIQIERGGN